MTKRKEEFKIEYQHERRNIYNVGRGDILVSHTFNM